jgi:hypothetical protein
VSSKKKVLVEDEEVLFENILASKYDPKPGMSSLIAQLPPFPSLLFFFFPSPFPPLLLVFLPPLCLYPLPSRPLFFFSFSSLPSFFHPHTL